MDSYPRQQALVLEPRVIYAPVGFIEYKEDMGECPACDGVGCEGCDSSGRIYRVVRKDLRELDVVSLEIDCAPGD